MATRMIFANPAPEKSTVRLTAVIKDEAGVAIPAATLTTLTLTLYALDATLTILNGVNGTNILNADRGTVDASGNLVIALTPSDNAILDTSVTEELRVALVQWTWAAGAKAGRHEIEYRVANLAKVS